MFVFKNQNLMSKKDEYLKLQKSFMEKALGADKLPKYIQKNLLEYLAFRHELTIESDRGSVLFAASYLDSILEKCLRKKFIGNKKLLDSLFDFSGPLGTFSGRISIAYSIGLITKNVYHDLHLVRKIRNSFGHSPLILNFENEKIKSQCNALVCIARNKALNPRQTFNTSVSFIAGNLEGTWLTAEKFIETTEDFLEKTKETMVKTEEILEFYFNTK